MKFTIPCFVRVDNEEPKARLINWILDIGNSYREDASGYIIACLGSRYENIHYAIPYSLVENIIDCGTDIELFKALAAMNDDNDREQWFTCELNKESIWWKCNQSDRRERYMKGCLLHKATAEEIVGHFKNRKR